MPETDMATCASCGCDSFHLLAQGDVISIECAKCGTEVGIGPQIDGETIPHPIGNA